MSDNKKKIVTIRSSTINSQVLILKEDLLLYLYTVKDFCNHDIEKQVVAGIIEQLNEIGVFNE